ncbi:MAG: HAD hydrolase family protein [Endomicrobium sp.]|jgi:3-deoxy-D-manno-octulosonate 8-phosphate phosphatase (KDO 8-P phosphatase)|nr:HAD hydrolase family protein [Endomicrobium sp.]
MSDNKNIFKKVENIKLLACDIDGVLTRGEIIIFNDGEEIKIWNAKDGIGFSALLRTVPRIKTAWITGRQSLQVEKRAKDLKIDYLISNCVNKKKALEEIMKENEFNVSEVAYIGDDIVDIPVLEIVGFSACPKDACEDVKKSVDYNSSFNGGEGAVREIIEIIMKAKGEWHRSSDIDV